jgi:hypothetical protein
MATGSLGDEGKTVTVRVPIQQGSVADFRLVLAPDGTHVTTARVRRHVDNAIIKAIPRALRWREMLEGGRYATIAEIAAAENINASYVGRVLHLTLLAPNIIEAIMDGRQPTSLQLADLMQRFQLGWREQRNRYSWRHDRAEREWHRKFRVVLRSFPPVAGQQVNLVD